MKQHIEQYFKDTIDTLEAFKTEKGASYRFPSEYKGYISSLGASILMSGLLPTLAVYYNDENNSDENRSQICDWIQKIIQTKHINRYDFMNQNLFRYLLDNTDKGDSLEEDVLNASVALKLCIRTFPFKSK